MTSQSTLLLKGGTLLIHDEDNHVVPTRADLLIEGNTITKIERDISSPGPPARVVDCTFKIISPGFISTHAHLWQTQFKGLHPNHTLVEYLPSGCYAGSFYTLRDLFWGQLAGAMECVDGGTTTVVDHSHLNLGADYPKTAIQALSTSGLRAIYCYTPPRRVTSFNPLILEEEDLTITTASTRVLDDFAALTRTITTIKHGNDNGNGRVSLGFAMDNLYLPPSALGTFYSRLRDPEARAKVITSHAVDGPRAVGLLDRAGALGRDVILSHAPGLGGAHIQRLGEAGAFVSSTPNTEMQMGMEPVSMSRAVLEAGTGTGTGTGVGSLGVDCHTWGTAYMPTQMNLALQQRRLLRGVELGSGEGQARWARRVEGSAEEVFNLGTVAGARAVGMEGEIGRLGVGIRADLVVFDGTSPGMLGAAVQDPVAAVVLHSSIRDVEMVVVDGVVRKEGGRLCDVEVVSAPQGLGEESVSVGTRLSWGDVARETVASRELLRGKIGDMDFGPAEEAVIDMWHMDRAAMVEK